MIITTRSGSKYVFTVKDNRLFFLNGCHEGVVISLSGLEEGQRLRIEYRSLNAMTYKESEEISFIQTTPIQSISF